MSSIQRNNVRADNGAQIISETQSFNKPFQTVGRPGMTEELNDQYMRDPPHNEPFTPTTEQSGPGLKEGAYEEEDVGEQVLGDQSMGRTKAEAVMSGLTQESTVHPNSSADADLYTGEMRQTK